MATLDDLMVHVGVQDEATGPLASIADTVDDNIGKIAAAGAAAGMALEGFARTQAPLIESSRRLAAATGEPVDEIQRLAKESSNVTFPLNEVYAIMESGRKQGLKSGAQLQEFAEFWDMVGDATGESGPALADSGVALRAVGVAAGDESKALGAFGFITEETTGSVGEFLNFLERTGPELRDMGMDVDDAAAIMGVLENEMGMTGRTARTEFRKAVNEADGDINKMMESLGVTGDQFDEYRGKVADSSEVIARNADIHADSYTVMQKAQHFVTELMHSHAGLFDAASALALPLMALGPVLKGVTTIFKSSAAVKVKSMAMTTAATVKNVAVQVARWVWLGVQSLIHAAKVAAAWLIAIGPIALVIAAVVGLVALIVKNWDTITRVTRELWASVAGWFSDGRDRVVSTVTNLRDRVVAFVTNLRDRAVATVAGLRDRVVSTFTGLRDRAVATVAGLRDRAVALVTGLRDTFVSTASGLRDRVVSTFTGLRDRVVATISGLMDRVRNIRSTILGVFANAGRWLFNAGRNIIKGLIDGIKAMIGKVGDAITGVASAIRSKLPFSPAKEGPLSGRGSPDLAGATLVEMIADGMGSQLRDLQRMSDETARAAMPRLTDPGVPSVRPGSVAGGDGAAVGGGLSSADRALLRRIADAVEDGKIIEMDGKAVGRQLSRAHR